MKQLHRQSSYIDKVLSDHSQTVVVGRESSSRFMFYRSTTNVSSWSLKFLFYIADIKRIALRRGLLSHFCAYNTQVHAPLIQFDD